jgi:elongator complex protein 3
VRCREVRGAQVSAEDLVLDDLIYQADFAEEHFLSFVKDDDRLAGFLRLSLPGEDSPETGISDLDDAAIIREVHIYGQSLNVGQEQTGAAQHAGLGTRLVEQAEEIARERGYPRMAVISAVGTRRYYLQRGYQRVEHYLVKQI